MTVVVGIRFKDSGKTYFFDPGDLELQQGEHVIVETVRGPELAKVAYEKRDVPEAEIVGELKPVVRRAESADFERMRLLQSRHTEVLQRCAEKIAEHGLPMKLVKAEYSFDGSRLTFYFTAEKRVDFRLLVRDLARTFRSRIELRQIGPRDEAKLLGGIGPCGRLLCCATFLPDYARVSIKMAKDQDLPLNPAKISGVCGRLLCCLSYEHEQYVEMRADLPRKGAWVQTPDGPGEVLSVNVLQQRVVVQLASSGMQESYLHDQIAAATEHVGAVARQRNAEGITPAAQRSRRTNNHEERNDPAERRFLRDEVDQVDFADHLDHLADDDPAQLADDSPGEGAVQRQIDGFDSNPPAAGATNRHDRARRRNQPESARQKSAAEQSSESSGQFTPESPGNSERAGGSSRSRRRKRRSQRTDDG